MNLIKRLFANKAKEILREANEAEALFNKAKEKMKYLEEFDRFYLLREELCKLIKKSNFLSDSIGMNKTYQTNRDLVVNLRKELDEVLLNMEECLNEMEDIKGKTSCMKTDSKS